MAIYHQQKGTHDILGYPPLLEWMAYMWGLMSVHSLCLLCIFFLLWLVNHYYGLMHHILKRKVCQHLFLGGAVRSRALRLQGDNENSILQTEDTYNVSGLIYAYGPDARYTTATHRSCGIQICMPDSHPSLVHVVEVYCNSKSVSDDEVAIVIQNLSAASHGKRVRVWVKCMSIWQTDATSSRLLGSVTLQWRDLRRPGKSVVWFNSKIHTLCCARPSSQLNTPHDPGQDAIWLDRIPDQVLHISEHSTGLPLYGYTTGTLPLLSVYLILVADIDCCYLF